MYVASDVVEKVAEPVTKGTLSLLLHSRCY